MITAPEVVVTSITLLVFGLLLLLTILRWRFVETVIVHLGLFIGLGFFTNLFLLLAWLDAPPANVHYVLLSQFSLLAMILTFGALTLNMLKKQRNNLLTYWTVAFLILLLWSALAGTLILQNNGSVSLPSISPFTPGNRYHSMLMVAGMGGIVAIGTVAINLAWAFKQPRPIQFVNRLRYWLMVTVLLSIAGAGLFVSQHQGVQLIALVILTAGTALASYNILSYQTLDLKLLFNWGLYYTGSIFVISSVTLVGFTIAIQLYRYIADPIHLLVWLIIVAILVGAVYRPILRASNYLLMNLIFGKPHFDGKQVIRKYSQTVRGTVDIHRLSEATINLMVESLNIERGVVFINERNGRGPLSLRPYSVVGLDQAAPKTLTMDNPIVSYFHTQKEILLSQYDIDEQAEFQTMSDTEREWLSRLGMEIYVPMLRNQELLGVLAFGPKSNGVSFSYEEKEWMLTLADQTALVLEGAILFQQLATINQEVEELDSRMSVLDRSKSDFLSIASHELKTPLTQIHTYSQLLLELTEEDLKDEDYVQKIFEGIAVGSERLKDVINMMLDVSAADLGKMYLFTGSVDMEEVYEQAVQPFLPVLDERRIALDVVGLADLPPIEADGTRLVQVVANLLGNAIKYTPDGGQVTITGQTTVTGYGDAAVEISVTDKGIGIDPEHHEKIFDKFFRVDDSKNHSTSKTKFKGAGPGLGLTLVKAVVESHNGEVWVDSTGCDEENYPGSTFVIVLPISSTSFDHTPLPQSKIITQTISYS